MRRMGIEITYTKFVSQEKKDVIRNLGDLRKQISKPEIEKVKNQVWFILQNLQKAHHWWYQLSLSKEVRRNAKDNLVEGSLKKQADPYIPFCYLSKRIEVYSLERVKKGLWARGHQAQLKEMIDTENKGIKEVCRQDAENPTALSSQDIAVLE